MSWVFAVNTATYLIVIAVLYVIRLPAVDKDPDEPKGLRRLLGGVVVARQNRTIRRVLLTMALFSLLCLPFVTQMPVIAERNLGIDGRSAAFGLFYACLGFGAVIGSLSIGTVFAGYSKRRLVRQGLALFAVSVAVLAVVREPAARVSRDDRGRHGLLRHRHLAVDGAPGAAGRPGPGPGHGPLGHVLRRHRAHRRPHRRPGDRGHRRSPT